MNQKQTRVFVGILAVNGTINITLGQLLFEIPLMNGDPGRSYSFIPWVCSGTRPQEFARNTIIQKAREVGYDILVQIDHDSRMRAPVGVLSNQQLERKSRQVNAGHPVHDEPPRISIPAPGACP